MTTSGTTSSAHGRRHGILVGVTGGGQDTAALRWAAERAARLGTRVTLVHAYGHLLPPPPPSVLMTSEPMGEAASYLVVGAVQEYLHLAPDGVEKPESLLDEGRPARALVELSREADLVVLSHRAHGHRIVTGSTAATVAAHAHCPTVVVPETWSPVEHHGAWVTVGVHEHGAPEAVIEAAAREASAAQAPLRMVHGWHLDTVYDDIISARIDADWEGRIERSMLGQVAPLLADHPALQVEVAAVHEWPADALVRLSATSRLLVVGRHAHVRPFPERLGSVARALIRTSTCPVMVVPVPAS